MNAQWNSRLPSSRSTPFSAASAGRSGSRATRKNRRRNTRADPSSAFEDGGAATVRSP